MPAQGLTRVAAFMCSASTGCSHVNCPSKYALGLLQSDALGVGSLKNAMVNHHPYVTATAWPRVQPGAPARLSTFQISRSSLLDGLQSQYLYCWLGCGDGQRDTRIGPCCWACLLADPAGP
jgi:hypothetical protein